MNAVGNRIIVRREKALEKTGNIYLHGAAFYEPPVGTVISVGEGRKAKSGSIIPIDVNEGDRVVFNKGAGTKVVINGEPLLVVNADDLIGLLDANDNIKL